MSTLYIATTGSDANKGTQDSPFLTLQKGVDAAVPGDTIQVAGGVYPSPNVGTSGFAVNLSKAGNQQQPFTIQAAPGSLVTLDGGASACHSYFNFGSGSAWWNILGFEIRNCWRSGIWSNSQSGKNVLIQRCSIHDIARRVDTGTLGNAGIYTDTGAQNFVVDRCALFNIGRTNDPGNSYDHGLYSAGNVTLQNCISWNMFSGWHVQTADGFNGLLVNNTMYGPNLYAGSQKPGQVVLWGRNTVIIRNNVSYGSRGAFISLVATTQTNSSTDHNCIYSPAGVLAVFDGPAPPGMVSTPNLFADPLLVNPVPGGDYHLLQGSPCAGRGSMALMPLYDYDGTPRVQPDIGAYAAASVPPPPVTVTTTSSTVTTRTSPDAKTTVDTTVTTTVTTVKQS